MFIFQEKTSLHIFFFSLKLLLLLLVKRTTDMFLEDFFIQVASRKYIVNSENHPINLFSL